MSQAPNDTVKNASAEGVDTASEGQFGQAGLLNPQRSPSGPGVGQLRGSRASMSAPTKERIFNPHATNPGRIPTAGGVAVGSKQFEQRRASRVSGDMGLPRISQQSPPLTEESYAESSKAESSKDGAANGSYEAPPPPADAPVFKHPEYDPDSVAPDAPAPATDTTTAPVADNLAASNTDTPAAAPTEQASTLDQTTTDQGATTTTTNDKSTTEKVKENLPSGAANKLSSSNSPTKERRGSRFESFKEKLGMGSGKK